MEKQDLESQPMHVTETSTTHYTVNQTPPTSSVSRLLGQLGLGRDKDENKERGNWASPAEFFMTAVGTTFNISKIRFAYLMYANSGAIFLINYIVATGLIGVPLVFMQLALGQFTSNGPFTCWNMARMFQGIGLFMGVLSGLICIYNAFLLVLALYYVFASFSSKLPWTDCANFWNTQFCLGGSDHYYVHNVTNNMNYDYDGTTYNNEDWSNFTYNYRYNDRGTQTFKTSPAEEYFNRYVLNIADGIESPGGMNWKLVFCLIAAWIMVLVGLVVGIKSLSKVMFWTVSCMYLLFFILFIRGITLPGAIQGLKYYIYPSLSGHASNITGYAMSQVIYEYMLQTGAFIMLGSYNKFHHNIMRDSIVICVITGLTSVCTGIVIFSYSGYYAHSKGLAIHDVVSGGGPETIFVHLPDVFSSLPVPQLWCFIFFSAIIYMLLNEQLILVKTVTTCFTDTFPKLRTVLYELIVTAIVCFVGFIFGLHYCNRTGIYWFNFMDWTIHRPVHFILLLMVICISFVYKFTLFRDDIKMMLGGRTLVPWSCCAWGWIVLWCCLSFLSLVINVTTTAVQDVTFSGYMYYHYVYPYWVTIIGWCLTALLILLLFVPLVYHFIRALISGRIKQNLIYLVRPNPSWGPALDEHRNLDYRYRKEPSAESAPMNVIHHA